MKFFKTILNLACFLPAIILVKANNASTFSTTNAPTIASYYASVFYVRSAGTGAKGSSGTIITSASVAASTALYQPHEIYVTTSGVMYFTNDDGLGAVYKVSNNVLTLFAGCASCSSASCCSSYVEGSAATSVGLWYPAGIAVDADGIVYIGVYWRVFRVSNSGITTTYVGNGGYSADIGDNGPATSASIERANGLFFDTSYNMYIADTYGRIRKVTRSTSIITTVAGNGDWSSVGIVSSSATDSAIGTPQDVYVDTNGSIYFTNDFGYVFKVSSGSISTFYSSTTVSFNALSGDSNGNLYIAERCCKMYIVDSVLGSFSVFAGNGSEASENTVIRSTASATNAIFNNVHDIFVDSFGTVYVTDFDLGVIYKFAVYYPSASPSYSPSIVPSSPPSITPTFMPSTTAPSLVPTIAPTSKPTGYTNLYVYATTEGTTGDDTFNVEATSSISITGNGGSDTYKIGVHSGVVYTITDFSLGTNVIVLTAFDSSYASDDDFLTIITRSPVTSSTAIIQVASDQKIVLSNLESDFEISASNFLFNRASSGTSDESMWSIIKTVLFSVIPTLLPPIALFLLRSKISFWILTRVGHKIRFLYSVDDRSKVCKNEVGLYLSEEGSLMVLIGANGKEGKLAVGNDYKAIPPQLEELLIDKLRDVASLLNLTDCENAFILRALMFNKLVEPGKMLWCLDCYYELGCFHGMVYGMTHKVYQTAFDTAVDRLYQPRSYCAVPVSEGDSHCIVANDSLDEAKV